MSATPFPNLSPNSPADDAPSDWAKRQPDDGSFDVATGAGWFARRSMQAHPEIERNVRATVRGLVGSDFTPEEIKALEDRALDKVEWDELGALRGVEAGVPVQLSPRQKTGVDSLLKKLGDDPLGQRARAAFDQGLKSGKIQVH